jgi:hypothetical protein
MRGLSVFRDMETNLSSDDEEISGLENIGTWGLELQEKAMTTDDKIQVSRNEGSVLGTRRQ